jgi:hypothetical protein
MAISRDEVFGSLAGTRSTESSLKPILQRFGLTLQGNETVGKGGQGTRAQRRVSPRLRSKIFAGSYLH